MNYVEQSFSIKFEYKVYFTSDMFHISNKSFADFLQERVVPEFNQKILFVIDSGVIDARPELTDHIKAYFRTYNFISLIEHVVVIPGGEMAKNNQASFDAIIEVIDRYGIDRHSYVAAIGGGSVLDLAGFASAVAHRGIKHLRIPTTVLAQNDSGVGVKNGINYKGKKNFLGTFVPPAAVFNDDTFLLTLSDRDWRSGISEAIKVALIKDAEFYYWIEANAEKLMSRSLEKINYLIRRCAELHLQHIASGDPFELGSSRPLDFGHWSAHKLEQLTEFKVLHGEAVAMGIAQDTIYSALSGRLAMEKADRIIQLLINLGFEITHPLLQFQDGQTGVLQGLQDFREHLGGRLTIMLLLDIGLGIEVHEIDIPLLKQVAQKLQGYQPAAL